MKQLNWYQIFGEEDIPDGKTVLPTDDVLIWQKCGGVKTKYATLSDVLADTVTLLTLINSSNAIDYLVRSTTFATTVCANANAMVDIGLNNYAANTLLADSTWRPALCHSTYFESVLNYKVPKMTSNNTPTGYARANAVYDSAADYQPWKAFDQNSSSWWLSARDSTSGWIRFDFPEPIRLYRTMIFPAYSQGIGVSGFIVQGSNNASTFNNIYSDTIPNSSSYARNNYFDTVADTEYGILRLNVTSSYSYGTSKHAVRLVELQFYGRRDV